MIVIVVGVVLPAGMKSRAPWTVEKSPEPSAATRSEVVPAAGPEALAEKVQAELPVNPGKERPVPSVKTPASTVTK